ncbi:hypothetical protein HYR54_01560 [Candidatus Acetothermia bacterium]|nr:hypothetical protein [Candidatus Acetothermia bacterium]
MTISVDLAWAVFALAVVVASVVAIGLAIRAELSRGHRFQAFLEAKKLLHKTRAARTELYQLDLSDPKIVSPQDKERIDLIVRAFNEIGLLIEKGYVSMKDVMGLAYPVFIRVWRQLEAYARHREELEGNRWARRVEWLAELAKEYHNKHPKHKNRKIFLYNEMLGKKLPIHEPKAGGITV